MKKIPLLILSAVTFAVSTFGQGTLSFTTLGGQVRKETSLVDATPVNVPTGAANGQFELLWAPSGTTDLNLFNPVPGAIVSCVPTAGRLSGGTRTIPSGTGFTGIAPGAVVSLVLRGWTGGAVSYTAAQSGHMAGTVALGYSSVFAIDTGDPTTTPAGTPAAMSSVFPGITLRYAVFPQLPQITAQSSDMVVATGATATLNVAVVSQPFPFQFQWYFNGSNILNATNSNYEIANVQTNQTGNYWVVVANQIGSVTSSNIVLQVLPSTNAPSISINGRLAAGTVSVASSGSVSIGGGFAGGLIFYTLNGSTPTFASTLYTGPFSQSTDATITAMSVSADFSQTFVSPSVNLAIVPTYNLTTATSGSGNISLLPATGPYLSNTVITLTANPAAHWVFSHWTGNLSGSINPTNLTMNGPRSVTGVFYQNEFPVTANTPGGGVVTVNGSPIPASTYYPTGQLLSVAATPDSGWQFINWTGSASGGVNPLNLVVTGSLDMQAVFGTTIGTNTFGSGNISLSNPNPVPYGTVLSATATPQSGYYFAAWSGAVSGTNNPTTITVTTASPQIGALFLALPGPTINAQPTNISAVLGTPATFNVAAAGVAPLSYQWRRSGVLIGNSTNASLTFAAVAGTNAGNYDVIVYDGNANSQTSSVASLTVLFPPAVSQNPVSQTVIFGNNASFSVTASGDAPLFYQWRKNGVNLFNTANVAGANTSVMGLSSVSTNDSGHYAVVITNNYGSITSSLATLTVAIPPTIVTNPTSQVLAAGSTLNLESTASGTEPITYQWFFGTNAIPWGTNSTLTVASVQTNASGPFQMIASSPYGSATSTVAMVMVYIPVTFISDPLSQSASAHNDVTFTVTATGHPAPNYQWYFNGSIIPWGTGSVLTITNLSTNNLGAYVALAWNDYSSATSSVANLFMSPSITMPFTGGTAIWGRDTTLNVGAIGSGPLSYQWYFEGNPIGSGTNASLNLLGVQLTNGGLYSVVISSPYGSTTNIPYQLVVYPSEVEIGLRASITIGGVIGYGYQIQYSTNLADTNAWITATNIILTQPIETWVDTSSDVRDQPRRFYKVLPQ